MKPIKFKEQTKELQKPKDMTDKECISLPVYCNGEVCISRWNASFIERIKFLITGKVWIGIHSGETQPPIYININNPFKKEIKDVKI